MNYFSIFFFIDGAALVTIKERVDTVGGHRESKSEACIDM